jgi:hypothetical protein
MMTMDDMLRVTRAQQRIFRCIEDELRQDGHHKSYEGAIEISLSLPNYFEQSTSPQWTISLHCYLLLDGRHQSWSGRTLPEAIAKMEAAIDPICMPYEMDRFGREMGLCVDEPEERDGSSVIYGASRAEEIPE